MQLLTDAPQLATLRSAVAATDAPVLLVTAGNVPDEAAAARWIASDQAHAEIWTVQGARHTGRPATGPDEWRTRVVAFLDDAIDAQP